MMDLNQISPDQTVFWQYGIISINATLVYTWGIMALLVLVSWLVTRRLTSDVSISAWQNFLEIIVDAIRKEIKEISQENPRTYIPWIGTLFLFLLVSNVMGVIPGVISPAASLSTTAALAICVFVAVPVYGIKSQGILGYLKQYVKPTPIMLPFHILGELSRTLALAVRLFGNMMSGTKIIAILLVLAPLVFPVLMNLLGLLTGVIQAYIFAVLAMVYIASATRAHQEKKEKFQEKQIKKGEKNG